MIIEHLGLNRDFINKYKELYNKYGESMMKLEGIDNDRLMPMNTFKHISESDNIANASVDSSANVSSKTIGVIQSESVKPLWKIFSHNKIYSELNEKYGKQVADEWFENQVNGALYLHDSTSASFLPYCYSFSLKKVHEKGLFFINEMKGHPAKHLSTWVNHVCEFIGYSANQLSGAVAIPDVLLYMYKYWLDDIDSGHIEKERAEEYKNQQFQAFIYRINQPITRDGVQSAYTNLQILDTPHLMEFFGGDTFNDGSLMLEYFEGFLEFQKDFLKYERELRKVKFFTFPVLTASLKIDENKEYEDEYVAKYVVEHNMEFQDVNIYNATEISGLSSCCFDGKQKVLSKGQNVIYDTFENTFNLPYNEYRRNFRIFHNGNWVSGNLNRIKRNNKKMFKVTTVNNKELLMTEDHISLTSRGDVSTLDLRIDDYIAFSNKSLQRIPERDMKLSYEQGVAVGAYLGDGSKKDKKGIVFSFSDEKINELVPIINTALKQWDIDIEENYQSKIGNCSNVVYQSIDFRNIIEFWVKGDYCNEKEINLECLLQSEDFRKGIIDGLYKTDGGNSNRIYSTSLTQTEGIEVILTSLGIPSIIDISDRTGDGEVVIRGEYFNRNYPVYCIRFYKHERNIRNIKDVYKVINNTTYFKIKNIEEYISEEEYVYCFDMKNKEEPYFTLPNGIITHNCRLVNDTKEIVKGKEKLEGFFSSIGGTSISIGSIKVCTANFARMAYESNGNLDKFYNTLRNRVELIHKVLDVHRDIIKKNVKRGLLPIYTHGLMDMDKQFGTVGINGLYECIDFLGGIDKNELGESSYNDLGHSITMNIFKIIKDLNAETLEKYGFTSNTEQVPAESASTKGVSKDRLLFREQVKDTMLYGNQWIPLSVNTSINNRIEASANYDTQCGGGAILHLNLGEPLKDFGLAWELTKSIAKKNVVYYSLINKFQYCEEDHSFYGKVCPICNGEAIGNAIKIVGYIVKDAHFEKTRKNELNNRVFYKITP